MVQISQVILQVVQLVEPDLLKLSEICVEEVDTALEGQPCYQIVQSPVFPL